MNEKLVKSRRILMAIMFFIIGATLQGIMIRRISFICYFILLAAVIFVMISDKKFAFGKFGNVLDIRDILLIIAMVTFRIATYSYYSESHDLTGNFIWATAPIMLYLFGKYLLLYNDKNSYETHLLVTFSLGCGLMVFNFISIISYYIYGPVGDELRDWHMMLMDNPGLRATFYAFYPLPFIALITWAVCSFKRNKACSLIVIITGLFSAIWFWFQVKTRQPFFVLVLAMMLGLLIIYIDLIVRNGFERYKKKTIIGIAIGIVLIVIAVLSFVLNICGIKDMYLSSTFCRDRPLLDNPRIFMAWSAVYNLKNYPFGNQHIQVYEGIEQSHVFWTELGYCGGIIPFAAGVLWLAFVFKDVVCVVVSRKISLEEKLLLVLSSFAVFFYTCTESLRDMFQPFMVMLFAGMIRGKILALNRQN